MTSIFLSGTLKRDKADEPWKEWRGVWAYGDLKDLKDDEIDKLSNVENVDEANRERGPLPFFFEVISAAVKEESSDIVKKVKMLSDGNEEKIKVQSDPAGNDKSKDSEISTEKGTKQILSTNAKEGKQETAEAPSELLRKVEIYSWKGKFVNVSKKCDRSPPKYVEEKFGISISKNGDIVESSGENRFGRFKLVGKVEPKLDHNGLLASLSCQKIYIFDEIPKKRSRGRPPRNSTGSISSCAQKKTILSIPKSSESTEKTGSGYYTRKRIMSWQRPSFGVEYDAPSSRPTVSKASKQHSGQEGTNKSTSGVNTSGQVRKRGRPPGSGNNRGRSMSEPANTSPSKMASASKQNYSKHSSSSQSHHQAISKAQHCNDGSGGTLPSTYDILDARWLSAHYMELNGSICVYEGDLDLGGGMRHGQGTTLYPNGFVYAGAFKQNKEHGYGTLTNPAGLEIYSGEWERGKIHGKGIYHYVPSGDVYEGEFSMNLRHGAGKYKMKDGSYYEGDWQNNMRCGRGTMCWADGSVFEGQWRKNERHGQGVLTASDGFRYEGQWANNCMEGRGVADYRNGPKGKVIQRYEGLWHNGRREGRGTVVFIDAQASYEGRFKNDKIEGQGTLKMDGATKTSYSDKPDSECDWLIPVEFQSDLAHILSKAGFTSHGE